MYQVIGDKETPAEACRVTYSHLGSHAPTTEPLLIYLYTSRERCGGEGSLSIYTQYNAL